MKILHIVPSYKPAYVYGGPIESVASLCEALVENGNHVSVYTTTANGETELNVDTIKDVNVDNVAVRYFPRITKGHTHVSPYLWVSVLRNCQKFDIVHIHSWWSPLIVIAAFLCHIKGVKVIISPRGMLSEYIITKTNNLFKKFIHFFIGRYTLRNAIFHATSELEYKECKALIKNWDGFLLPNLIKLPKQIFPRQESDVFTLIFLSRIHPKKGIELLFQAISQLNVPVVLKIAGDGEKLYIDELKKYARLLTVSHSIEWLGWKNKEDKFVELASANLFVLTSFNENFANVVIESLYVGTPVLLTDTVGLSKYVQKNNLGWIAKIDVEDIRLQLTNAINDRKKRSIINATGRSIIETHFSQSSLANQYIYQYHRALDDTYLLSKTQDQVLDHV